MTDIPYYEQGAKIQTNRVPQERRHNGKSDLLAVNGIEELPLCLDYNARATIVRQEPSEQARLAAFNVEYVMLSLDESMVRLEQPELSVSPIYYIEDHRLPTAIEDIVKDRIERLTYIATRAYGVSEDEIACSLELLTRKTGYAYHRDPEKMVYVETLLGQGTCLSGRLGECFTPLTRWNYSQIDEGQGLLFNLDGQALHAGPEWSAELPRLGLAFFMDLK